MLLDFWKRGTPTITRFAPSPTGELHVGGARTALFAFLFAKHHGGKFLLRIEDTDRERYMPESVGHIIEALDWLGLTPDNKGRVVVQSERLPIYKKYALQLLDSDNAYICNCSKEKLAADRERQMQEKKPPRYEGHCRNLDLKINDVSGKEFVIRMKMPEKGNITVNDLIKGDVVFDLSLFDDQILLKSDGYPTYHLASVVDDHEMEITHVIRAEEWLPSTPKHLILYRMLGWKIPEFAHLPMILAPDRSKLSKRHGATGVFEYKKMGYLPEAMLNFIALLGWHSPDNREIFSVQELIKEFSLNRVQKGGAIFDVKKLDWLNGQYIKEKPEKDLWTAIKSLYAGKITADEGMALKILKLGKGRMERLQDFLALQESLILPEYETKLLLWKNSTLGSAKESLRLAKERIESISGDNFNKKSLEAELMPVADSRGRGELLWPLRVALSGKDKSLGPFELMEIMGKEESLRRIDFALSKL